jgi:DNA modification methylase
MLAVWERMPSWKTWLFYMRLHLNTVRYEERGGRGEVNQIHIGDCRELMAQFVAEGIRVQTCITSPPYYGLRDYGAEGQFGLEAYPAEYLEKMVDVFGLVKKLLADDGTLWLNMGDSYAGSWGAQGRPQGDGEMLGRSVTSARQIGAHPRFNGLTGARGKEMGFKPKDLMGMPWRLAFALQADGWYLRSDIIWHKPNPMPESVTDRPTKSHEYIFLFSKSEQYFYDQEAILEPVSQATHMRLSQNLATQIGSHRANGGGKTNGPMKAVGRKAKLGEEGTKHNASFDASVCLPVSERNKRSVWTVATEAYSEAHFATFPRALIVPCVLAGSRAGDVVFDPFMGSGTTALVAKENGRRYLECELNPKYKELQDDRLAQEVLFVG